MNSLNSKYAETLVKQGKAWIISSEIKDGFILNCIRFRDSYGIVRYGTYREKIEVKNEEDKSKCN